MGLTIQEINRAPALVRQAMADANTVYSARTTIVALTATLTAARTLTLPAASSFPAGTQITFVDEIGGVTATNTVAIKRAGSDTINGLTSTFTLYTTNVEFALVTDGISKWTGGVVASPSPGTFSAWIPTFTGFSADPTSVTARYIVIGKLCIAYLSSTAGTSNATGFTVTLPFTAANTANTIISAIVTDASVVQETPGRILITANSNIATISKASSSVAFSATGGKNVIFTIMYEIA